MNAREGPLEAWKTTINVRESPVERAAELAA